MVPIWYVVSVLVLIPLFCFLRKAESKDICVAALIVAAPGLFAPFLWLTGYLRPLTYDGFLGHFDLTLGLDGFRLARFCARHSLLSIILASAYEGLPIMAGINWILERSKTFLRAALIGAVLAVPFYLLIPACGPRYAFVGYPWHPIVPTGLIGIASGHPRNCFPSMHLAWAVLLVMNAKNRIWKSALAVYMVLIVLATVGGGEHYFLDLIAAVPMSFAAQEIAERSAKLQWAFQGSQITGRLAVFQGAGRIEAGPETTSRPWRRWRSGPN